ncbi:MAG TPA: RNA-binding protein [Turneriella sp.]|nr:RNA-binding protein [Turneriella sp.]HNN00241.1 RNA-binding protein [Turneriella sp.]
MNIYVGNLAYTVTEQQLAQAFSEFGTVSSAKLIMDRDTGRAKGFAFVEMADKSEGIKAIAGMNGRELNNRPIVVNEARPREERGGFGGGGGGRGGNRGGGGGGRGGNRGGYNDRW